MRFQQINNDNDTREPNIFCWWVTLRSITVSLSTAMTAAGAAILKYDDDVNKLAADTVISGVFLAYILLPALMLYHGYRVKRCRRNEASSLGEPEAVVGSAVCLTLGVFATKHLENAVGATTPASAAVISTVAGAVITGGIALLGCCFGGSE